MSIALKAQKRDKIGTSNARRIKNQGLIPAVIYDQKGNINFSIDVKEFETEYFKGESLTTIIEIELDGKKHRVIPHKIELDPVSDRPVHVDFMFCDNEKKLRVKPKLVFINQDKSPGIKKGGLLHIVLRRVEVICESEKAIPQNIEVDIAPMHLGTKIRAQDLKFPAGVKLKHKNNFLIGSLIGRGKSEDDKAVDPNAPATGATSATPASGSPAQGSKADDKKDSKK